MAAVLALVGVLIAFVLTMDDADDEQGDSGERPPGQSTVSQNGEGSDLGAPESASPEGGSPDEGSPDEGSPDEGASEEGTPPEDSGSDSGEQDNQPVSGGSGSGGGSSAPPEGPAQSPDPLGLEDSGSDSGEGGGPADSATLQNTGIRSVATKFVAAAYGYAGDDAKAYASEVSGLVEPASFPESDGGRLVERNRERLRGGESMQSAARLESMSYVREVPFEEISPPLDYQDQGEAHEVMVRYVSGEGWAYNDDGEPVLDGEKSTYSQRVVFLEKLDPYDPEGEDRLSPGWRVVRASLPEEE